MHKMKTDEITSKLNKMSFDSILLRENRANGNKMKNVTERQSILKLFSDSYHIPKHALVSVLRYYTGNLQRLSILNESSIV